MASAFNHCIPAVRLLQDRVRIFSAMSHDLKTPVTRRGCAPRCEDAELKAKFAADLELMETMVNANLDFARGMRDREVFQPVDIMALIEASKRMRKRWADPWRRGHAMEPYRGKPLALKRCIGNLVDNANQVRHGQGMVQDDGSGFRSAARCRTGDTESRARAGVRALLSPRVIAQPGKRRNRPRPRHRPQHRPSARRRARLEQRRWRRARSAPHPPAWFEPLLSTGKNQ